MTQAEHDFTKDPDHTFDPEMDGYFGVCPHCRRTDGCVNVGSSHWGICIDHHVKWPIGANLFSNWMEESEELWMQNADRLEKYTEVDAPRPSWAYSGEELSLIHI